MMKKNKRAITQLKAYFLIVNIVLAIVAFGWIVSGQDIRDIPVEGTLLMPNQGGTSGVGTTTTLPNGPVIYDNNIWASTLKDGTYTFTRTGADGKIITTSGITDISNTQVLKEIPLSESTKIGDTTITKLYEKPSTNEFVGMDNTGKQITIKKSDLAKAKINIEAGQTTKTTDIWSVGRDAIIGNALTIGAGVGIGYFIGGFIGGNADVVLGGALAAGTFVYQLGSGKWGSVYKFANA